MQILLTPEAVDLIRRRGGSVALDFIRAVS
jgi:hypothetical protein